MDFYAAPQHDLSMAENLPNIPALKKRYFFREWRTFRGLTQEKLAELTGYAAPGISQLEAGKQGFTNTTLEDFARALDCTPADLVGRNPLDDQTPVEIWNRIRADDRIQALEVLKAFIKSHPKK